MTRVGNLFPDRLADRVPASIATRRINWVEVARMDLANARRSSMLWTLGGAFGLLMLLVPLLPILLYQVDPTEIPLWLGAEMLSFLMWLLISLIALLVGCMAVVSEREAGTARALLDLPITRRDIVIGKLLARSVIMTGMLLFGLALAGIELWYLYGPFDLGWYATFVGIWLGYGLVFVWIGVGISAFFRTYARALAGAVSAYALFVLVWDAIPRGVFYLVEGQVPKNVSKTWDPPAWFVFLENANPFYGYFALSTEWLSFNPLPAGVSRYKSESFEGTSPFYLQPEFMVVVLALWVLGPLMLGAWRFGRSDLG